MYKVIRIVQVFILCCVSMTIFATEPLSDPMRPAAHSVIETESDTNTRQTPQRYKVSQIFISSRHSMAIINGQTVRPGDIVEEAEVIAIKADRVELLIGGVLKKVSMTPSFKQYKH